MSDAAALALLDIRRARRVLSGLPPDVAPRTDAEGVAAQVALARRLGVGAPPDLPPAGFKIGATGRAMRDYLGLAGPLASFMAPSALHASGATLPFAAFLHPGAECEIAVRLRRDLPPGPCGAAAARDAVGELFAAIELVENRYGDLRALGTPTLLADQVFHAAAVLGAPYPDWRALDLRALVGRMTADGAPRGEGRGDELLGDPMAALAFLAASPVAAAFGGLRAGQVVMLGSVVPPAWLPAPAVVEVAFPPLPPVRVTLG